MLITCFISRKGILVGRRMFQKNSRRTDGKIGGKSLRPSATRTGNRWENGQESISCIREEVITLEYFILLIHDY